MFYEVNDKLNEIDLPQVTGERLTTGYIDKSQAQELCARFGFAASTAQALQNANERFRSGVEVYDDYTFTELRIADAGSPEAEDDCVALYIKKNLLIVVDVEDHDDSTKNKFIAALRRYPGKSVTLEKIICAFLDALLVNETMHLEDLGLRIADLEADIFHGKADKSFHFTVLNLKKHLLKMHNYYEQLLDITQALDEDENGIFGDDRLMYLANVSQKIVRLREDADSLNSTLSHMQDAYSAHLDLQLNNIMKFFTVITSIFFPLTLIAGWYGMNFVNMPELTWKYGYVYVIALSAVTTVFLILLGKRKKWF